MPDAPLPLWRRLRRRLWWALLVVVLALVRSLPLGAARRVGGALGALGRRLRRRERDRARENLRRVFPAATAGERERLLALSARRLGENLADTLLAPRLRGRPGFVAEEPCAATGGRPLGDVLAALAADGRGVIVLTGHLGCWELLGAWLARELARRGRGPLGAVTGTVRNPAVDRLLQRRRRELGLHVLPRAEGAVPLARFLKRGGVVAVLLDQNTRAASRPVPFCGHPAPTPTGPARLALRYGIPLLPVAIGRDGDGHRVRHLPPLLPAGHDEASLLAAANGALEALIRRNPAEWVWFHRRWEDR